MALWGDHVGSPGKGWSDMEMQEIGLRIESLAKMVSGTPSCAGAPGWTFARRSSG
jgi:hypothetical protein